MSSNIANIFSNSNISKLAASMVTSTSPFTNQNIIQDMTPGQYILFFIILILLILLVNYIGAFLFNMSVVKIMPSIKPIDTLHFFVLNIVLHILFC
jgi:hypothetical protein